jgi:hypothetical protein
MSFPRKWESRTNRNYWTPAPVPFRVFAGVTNWELLEVPLNFKRYSINAFSINLRSLQNLTLVISTEGRNLIFY